MKIKQFKNALGVTLAEILIAIIIIGVIISFGIPYYSNVLKTTRQKTAKLCLGLIKDAQEIHFDEYGIYVPPQSSSPIDLFQSLGGGSETQGINDALHLVITGDFLEYRCTFVSATEYTCSAYYPNYATAQWHCDVTPTTQPTCPSS